MFHYVTLLDSVYLPQGISLHASLQRNIESYTLWILCVDNEAYEILNKINLPNVRLLKLSELETKELLSVKTNRTKAEYCWTLTPFAVRFVFDADLLIERVTYVDADLWFIKNPQEIFDEFDKSEKDVLITEHSYAPEYDQSKKSGRYCVQFMIFSRTGGEIIRSWWEERCLEWCFARYENGKFGDQMYLDQFPNLFNDRTHVLQNRELALAPWNATRFPYSTGVIYHFHGLKYGKTILLGRGYLLPKPLIENVYSPYLVDLAMSIEVLRSVGYIAKKQWDCGLFFVFIVKFLNGFCKTANKIKSLKNVYIKRLI